MHQQQVCSCSYSCQACSVSPSANRRSTVESRHRAHPASLQNTPLLVEPLLHTRYTLTAFGISVCCTLQVNAVAATICCCRHLDVRAQVTQPALCYCSAMLQLVQVCQRLHSNKQQCTAPAPAAAINQSNDVTSVAMTFTEEFMPAANISTMATLTSAGLQSTFQLSVASAQRANAGTVRQGCHQQLLAAGALAQCASVRSDARLPHPDHLHTLTLFSLNSVLTCCMMLCFLMLGNCLAAFIICR